MKHIIIPAFCLAIFATSCGSATETKESSTNNEVSAKNELANNVADAYGIGNFDKVSTVAFTFNLEKDTMKMARNWVWNVKDNVVTLSSDKENVTYKRDTIQSAAMKEVDGKFINDQYWLMFPYHLVWDSAATITVKENVKSPLENADARMLTIQYKDEAGYTPGDAYDLYVNKDNMITEWAYRKSGAAEPTLATTWADTKDMNGLKLAMDHVNPATKFRIFFTGVDVK